MLSAIAFLRRTAARLLWALVRAFAFSMNDSPISSSFSTTSTSVSTSVRARLRLRVGSGEDGAETEICQQIASVCNTKLT